MLQVRDCSGNMIIAEARQAGGGGLRVDASYTVKQYNIRTGQPESIWHRPRATETPRRRMQDLPPLLHNSFPVWIICHASPWSETPPSGGNENFKPSFSNSPSLSLATWNFCRPPSIFTHPRDFIHVTSTLKSLAGTVTKDSLMTSEAFLLSLTTALASTSCEICVYTDIYPLNIKLRLSLSPLFMHPKNCKFFLPQFQFNLWLLPFPDTRWKPTPSCVTCTQQFRITLPDITSGKKHWALRSGDVWKQF